MSLLSFPLTVSRLPRDGEGDSPQAIALLSGRDIAVSITSFEVHHVPKRLP
jgi:hypothetical protein